MTDVKLVGLDFGTTTSSAVVARAKLLHNSVSGRTELSQVTECFRSPMAFTPIVGDRIDEVAIESMLDEWLAAGIEPGESPFGGGALLTGLTAQRENAAALVAMIRRRIGDAVIANADDPHLESWLAFMGNTAPLSRRHPITRFVNLDIGGGTTNIALGLNGEVLATACQFIGARHVQVVLGSYCILQLSTHAVAAFSHLRIHKQPGDELSTAEVDRIVEYDVQRIIAATTIHDGATVTLSGGVGELVYAAARGDGFPATTAYGDLGIDLARRLLTASPWADDFRTFVPEAGGRATSFGLLRHSTQVSGSTLFLADPSLLPLRDLPILGTIEASLPAGQWRTILELLRSSPAGGCVQIALRSHDATAVRDLGTSLAQSLRETAYPVTKPLVVIVAGNVGKALGHYITAWGALPLSLVVIDEIAVRDAQFVHLGRLHDGVVPVSFYGLQA